MQKTSVVARILLGLIFVTFGLNGFLHFIPMGPLPTGPAMQFITAVSESHYMAVVFALQLICGSLLLIDRYVPLALTILAAIIVNILLFHASMAPAGLPMALIVTILWMLAAYRVRGVFARLVERKVTA